MIKAFIFDLDGVITDTAEFHYQAWKILANNLGWDFDRDVNEQLRGVSRMDSIHIIANHNQAKITNEDLIEQATKKNNIYVKSLSSITPNDYLPGAKELLDDLKSEGFKIGLGSASKNSKTVLEQLRALDYFNVIGDGNSVTKSKPAPDVFLFASENLGFSPSECIVVEDAESGVDAAKAGGFHSIGIGPVDRVGHADLRFDEMKDISLSIIKAQFKELFQD